MFSWGVMEGGDMGGIGDMGGHGGAWKLIHIFVDFHNVFDCELKVTMKNVMELNRNMNHGVLGS